MCVCERDNQRDEKTKESRRTCSKRQNSSTETRFFVPSLFYFRSLRASQTCGQILFSIPRFPPPSPPSKDTHTHTDSGGDGPTAPESISIKQMRAARRVTGVNRLRGALMRRRRRQRRRRLFSQEGENEVRGQRSEVTAVPQSESLQTLRDSRGCAAVFPREHAFSFLRENTNNFDFPTNRHLLFYHVSF